jgi:hypothetical protein
MYSTRFDSRRSALRALAAMGVTAAAVPARLWAQPADSIPVVLDRHHVTAVASEWMGRKCLAVELTDEDQARVRVKGGNGPSYAIVARDFTNGTIEVDIASVLTGKGGADSRGFAGIAFHITPDLDTYEAFYLRMTNGRLNDPPPPVPRIDRAIQYVAHPDFHFFVSRDKFPGRYERGADVALGRWQRFRIEIAGPRARAFVDGKETLAVDDLHYAGRRGPVGLFIDDGSRGYFRDLRITPA